MIQLENKYECSGMCDIPLFYLSKSLSFGPPIQDCLEAFIKDNEDDVEVAVVALFGALSFWAAAISAMPNCCGGKKQKDKGGKHVELSEDYGGLNTTREMSQLETNRSTVRSNRLSSRS